MLNDGQNSKERDRIQRAALIPVNIRSIEIGQSNHHKSIRQLLTMCDYWFCAVTGTHSSGFLLLLIFQYNTRLRRKIDHRQSA